MANGEQITLALAERGIRLSHGLWVREIRQREDSGHQVSMLSTDYGSQLRALAMRLFGRWTQEHLLKYMREHYVIDRLVEYGTEPLPESTTVVNPAWRQIDSQVCRDRVRLAREQAAFGALNPSDTLEPEKLEHRQQDKARPHQTLTTRETHLTHLKAQRK